MPETTASEIIGQALADGFVTWEEVSSAPAPGKYQGNPDKDRPLVIALDAMILNGFDSESCYPAEGESIVRVDRWLVMSDSQGFVSVVEYVTQDDAMLALQGYREACADDAEDF